MRPHLSSQDIREKILAARDELVANVEFIMECIYEDRLAMEAYKRRFKDLRYRPSLGTDESGETTYGAPTELVLEPLAGKYRATINSLLQSIRLIESEILPEDNPEGSTANSNTKPEDLTAKRTSLRDQFKSAVSATTEIPAELVSNSNIGSMASNKPASENVEDDDSDSMPQEQRTPKQVQMENAVEEAKAKPWRNYQSQQKTAPKSVVAKEPVEKAPIENKPVSLENPNTLDVESERLRNELRGLKGSGGMSRLREKYGKKS